LTHLQASGNIGKIILKRLIASASFTITAISRKESEAAFPQGVTVIKTDFSESSLESAFQGQDAVISVIGASGFSEQKTFVNAAIRARVQRFIPSEFSANSQSDAVLQLLPLFRQKNDLIKYLQTKESSGLTWTGIATSGLFDWVSDLADSWILRAGISNPRVLSRVFETASWSSTFPLAPRLFGMAVTRASR
jgi:uncharacterized protein YbjT (DUF2867 family)